MSRSQALGPPQIGYSSPPRAGSRIGPAVPGAPSYRELGSRCGGTCLGIALRQEGAGPLGPAKHPPRRRTHPSSSLPAGSTAPLTSNELAGHPAVRSAPGRPPRASPADLVLFSSESAATAGSPLPGSRGRGGRSRERLGPGGVPAGWPHKGKPRLAAPHSTLRRAPSAPPAPRPLLKGRAPGCALGQLAERHRK